MRLTPISNKIASELKKVENAKKSPKAYSAPKKASFSKQDSSSFTSDARRLSESKAQADIAAARIAMEPDIRVEKVNEVKKKVANGYYNTSEFADRLAEKMCDVFGIKK